MVGPVGALRQKHGGGGERAKIGNSRRTNPLLCVHNYVMTRGIARGDSIVTTCYATFETTRDRFRGGSGERDS